MQNLIKICASKKNKLLSIMDRLGTILELGLANQVFFSVIVLSLPIVYITGVSGLFLGFSIGQWVLPSALLLLLGSVAFLHRKEKPYKLLFTFFLFLLFFAFLALFASQLFDTKYDSRAYHASANLALLDGANPLHEPKNWHNYHYPVAHWIISASLISWTQSFEASFSLTYLATLVGVFASWRFLASLPRITKFWRISLASLFALNPITIWCFFTGYIDGFLVSILLSSFTLMLIFCTEEDKQQRFRYGSYIVVLLILLINIKFSGLIYGGILGITALLYAWAQKVKWKSILRLVGLGTVAGILGTSIFGFFPYVTNAIADKDPFSSAFDTNHEGKKQNRIDHFFSDDFNKRTRYEKAWISLFSQSSGGWNRTELPPFSSTNPTSFLLGFGSIFSGALLLCLTLVFLIRDRASWIILGGIACSIFSTEAAFYFRLSPQYWWLPLFFIAFFFAQEKKLALGRLPQIMAIVIFLCLFWTVQYKWKKKLRYQLYVRKHIVENLLHKEGWYAAPDITLEDEILARYLYNYYSSGLTSLKLPIRKSCPPDAEQKKLPIGIVLCRSSE